MALSTVCFTLLLLSSLGHASHDQFSYDGLHGPQHWGEEYNTCVGKHQSPINIEEHIVLNVHLSPLIFSGMEIPRSTYLINNGHTVMLKMNDSDSAGVTGGPLGSDTYVFEQLHFHWGENDLEGSEDKINNHSFAMELHAVFYKKLYGSMSLAVDHPDGLAVLAYFFEASEDDNPTYNSIVDSLPVIEAVDSRMKLPQDLVLEPLLVPKTSVMHNYFTYNGSLTTPPCSEVVTWIDFKDPLPLSHKQIAAFRDVKSSAGSKLTHNFRPVQPLEDRVVYHNVLEVNGNEGHSEIADNIIHTNSITERSIDTNKITDRAIESNTIAGARSGQIIISSSIFATVAAFLFTFRSTIALAFILDSR